MTQKNTPLFWGTIIFVVITFSFIPKNEMNNEVAEFFDPSLPIYQSIQFATENLSGFQNIYYSLKSGEDGGANNPQYLLALDQFSIWLRKQPEVTNVSSYIDITKNLNKAMHGDDETYNRVPDSRELAAQYLLLYEMSLPMGMDLTQDINRERSSIRMSISLKKLDDNTILAFWRRADNWLDSNAKGIKYEATSQSLMFATMGEQLMGDMISGSVFIIIFITLVMIVGLRSIKYGLLSLIPNLIPAGIVYGIWGMTIGVVDQAALMTFSISIGLVVDDTVHILSKYLHGKRQGFTKEESIQYAFSTSGTALIVTTLTLCVGFGFLFLSHFTPNETFAAMISAIIFVAIFLDFLFLPALLVRVDKDWPVR